MTVAPQSVRDLTPAERDKIARIGRALKRWQEQADALKFDDPPSAELAPYRMLEFIRLRHSWFVPGMFHRELCAALDQFSRDVAAKKSPRLLIMAPPRHGKSQIVSRDFPVYHMVRCPTHEIIVSSYGQEFANDLSRDARAVRDGVKGRWPDLEPGDRDGIENWRIRGGGSYFAVGAGGPLTGRGMHVGVVDDPIKNFLESRSETTRRARWEWYTSTFYTRLHPGGGVLAMQTRWHEEDPAGMMLKQLAAGTEQWKVIKFPAIAEEDEYNARGMLLRRRGEALHAERYDLEALERIRGVTPARMWSALYQQSPTPDMGSVFDRNWLEKRYAHDPQRPPEPYDEIMVSIDATLNDAATSDFVAMVVIGRKGMAQFDILDEVHDRMTYVGLRQAARDLITKWRPKVVLIERAASGHALIDELKKEFPSVLGFSPSEFGSKDTRAITVTPMFEAGNVRFPKDGRFVSDFVEELAAFPSGAHDDRVDAVSQALLWFQKKYASGATTATLLANMKSTLAAVGRR